MDITNYSYTLTYKNDSYTNTVSFCANVNSDELKENLKLFLLGCSWQPKTVRDMFSRTEEDYFNEREDYKELLKKIADDEGCYYNKVAKEVLDEYN